MATVFPFPITEVGESTSQSMPEQTPYLFCKTHKARFWAVCNIELWEEVAKKAFFYHIRMVKAKSTRTLEIRAERGGSVVGELHLHNTDQLVPFLLASGDCIKTGAGQSVDLVAIYRSLVHERYHHHEHAIISERYRVLWVEWDNGIACRLGSNGLRRQHGRQPYRLK